MSGDSSRADETGVRAGVVHFCTQDDQVVASGHQELRGRVLVVRSEQCHPGRLLLVAVGWSPPLRGVRLCDEVPRRRGAIDGGAAWRKQRTVETQRRTL